MEKRNVKITIEQAEEWLKNDQLKDIALEAFPELKEKSLPKSLKELGEIRGYYVSNYSEIEEVNEINGNGAFIIAHRNIFATKEQAEASLAFAQLSQLKKVYNGDWEADWNNSSQAKYTICFTKNDIVKDKAWIINTFLSFKSSEIRDLFFENFQDLIEQARPLMS